MDSHTPVGPRLREVKGTRPFPIFFARAVRASLVALTGLSVVMAVQGRADAGPRTDVSDGPAATPHCPLEMALVGASCVDRWEGSLLEIQIDDMESVWETPFNPYTPPVGHTVRAVSRPGVVPQAHISMLDAQRACKNSGKRLCHAGEWRKACKGPAHTRYPYGDTRVPGACTDTDRTSPVMVLKGGDFTSRAMNDPALNQLSNTLALTGEATACTNGYGVFDMVGNLHEWVDDAHFQGGYYLDTTLNGEGCDYVTSAHADWYYDYSTGFRCCADADNSLRDDPLAVPPP
jgi:hypothetical protein